jgi:signal transduction histidine kinase/integral membrane sensor domain MASE1
MLVADQQNSRAADSFSQLAPRLLLAAIGLALVFLCSWRAGNPDGLWLPGLGVGLALVAWLGPWVVPLLALDLFLAGEYHAAHLGRSRILMDSLLLAAEMGLSWWVYATIAKGARRLEDPRSATVFLLLVPGAMAAALASIQALYWGFDAGVDLPFFTLASRLWISRALGVLTVAPPLLVVVTPLLIRYGLIPKEPPQKLPGGNQPQDWTSGEMVETLGLSVGAGLLALVLVVLHVNQGQPPWALGGLFLLMVVWASLRQGLRGGSLTVVAGSTVALVAASFETPADADFSPLQGILLALSSTALLVGASAGWIRASEARYRQMVGHMPVVLYSARLPRGLDISQFSLEPGLTPKRGQAKGEKPPPSGRDIVQQAEVTLVGPACRAVFDCFPEDLLGQYAAWLDRIDPADRELLIAALAQLCLQNKPVTCEYRVLATKPVEPAGSAVRWVRDTLVPFRATETILNGWEGVIEDITEQRALAQNLRRSNSMLQALVTFLPTGVFFVQSPGGQPIMVNQRARQLLGQREDLAAGIPHLSEVYRLHRTDGSLYPAEELPVAKALQRGISCTANDIVVHRPDGKRVPLVTWAAPVDWSGKGYPDAAVWVLEDLTALQQAQTARRESEARLRGVIETMAEGVVVQNQKGEILECNPAACTILGLPHDKLLGRPGLCVDGCLREDGSAFPRAEQPDLQVVQAGAPVRNVIMGVPLQKQDGKPAAMRWIFVNSMPLPVGNGLAPNTQGARVVTTFADITEHREALSGLERAQRQELVGRLASGTVHDFNNFLTVMIGLASLVQTALPIDHPAQQDLQRLLEAGEQASHLAGQMLAFSKQKKIELHAVDLNTIVIHSLKLLKGTLPALIQVEHQLEGDVLLVHADETQLKQVVMNLCLNAREAMDKDGTLTVRTEKAPDGYVKLVVQDTGHGMDPETQSHIFEPFFSTKERGTGLGLAVVRQIVEALGGRIEVASKPNEGTRMTVILKSYTE